MKKLDETWRPKAQFAMGVTVGFSANHVAKEGGLEAVGNTLYLPNGTWIAFPGAAEIVTMITETCAPKGRMVEAPEGMVPFTTFVTQEMASAMTKGDVVGFSISSKIKVSRKAREDYRRYEERLLIREIIGHPAGFAIELLGDLYIRLLEDGRFAVGRGLDGFGALDIEHTYDDLQRAVAVFVRYRHLLRLGADYEVQS